MTVRKLSDGQWVADFYTVNRSDGKQGKRVRKKFSTKGKLLHSKTSQCKRLITPPG